MMGQEARIPPTGVDFLIPHPRLTNGISINATKWYAVYSRSHYHSKLNNSKTTGYRFVHSTSGAWNLQRYTSIHIPFQKASTKSVLTKKKRPAFFGGTKNPKDPGDKRPFSTMDSTGNFKTPHSEEMMILFSLVTCSEMGHPSTDEPPPKPNGWSTWKWVAPWKFGDFELGNPIIFQVNLVEFQGCIRHSMKYWLFNKHP